MYIYNKITLKKIIASIFLINLIKEREKNDEFILY